MKVRTENMYTNLSHQKTWRRSNLMSLPQFWIDIDREANRIPSHFCHETIYTLGLGALQWSLLCYASRISLSPPESTIGRFKYLMSLPQPSRRSIEYGTLTVHMFLTRWNSCIDRSVSQTVWSIFASMSYSGSNNTISILLVNENWRPRVYLSRKIREWSIKCRRGSALPQVIDSFVAKVWRNVRSQYQFKAAIESDLSAAMFFGGIDLYTCFRCELSPRSETIKSRCYTHIQ